MEGKGMSGSKGYEGKYRILIEVKNINEKITQIIL